MNTNPQIKVQAVSPLIQEKKIPLPAYATGGAAAMDLHACLTEELLIPGNSRRGVPTGIAIELPGPQLVALVFPRSGLASKHGISLSNAVGVIDSDYRGEIICLIKNESPQDFSVKPGDRIAQLAFFPVTQVVWEEVKELTDSQRGQGGFGSTGVCQIPK